jgi:hypothetical protein
MSRQAHVAARYSSWLFALGNRIHRAPLDPDLPIFRRDLDRSFLPSIGPAVLVDVFAEGGKSASRELRGSIAIAKEH